LAIKRGTSIGKGDLKKDLTGAKEKIFVNSGSFTAWLRRAEWPPNRGVWDVGLEKEISALRVQESGIGDFKEGGPITRTKGPCVNETGGHTSTRTRNRLGGGAGKKKRVVGWTTGPMPLAMRAKDVTGWGTEASG